MLTKSQEIFKNRAEEIALDYMQRGYQVLVNPTESQVPDFLKNYHPDIIAKNEWDSIVVGIHPTGKVRRNDYWTQLANTINEHPGWRFDLVLDSRKGKRETATAEAEPSLIEVSEIEQRLQTSEKFTQDGLLVPALLTTWSATEAAMRFLANRDADELDLPNHKTETLISRLYTEGYLDREDYDLLIEVNKARNLVANGYREETITLELVEKTRELTYRLLQE